MENKGFVTLTENQMYQVNGGSAVAEYAIKRGPVGVIKDVGTALSLAETIIKTISKAVKTLSNSSYNQKGSNGGKAW